MWKRVITPILVISLLWIVISGTTTYLGAELSRRQNRVLMEKVAIIRSTGAMQEYLWQLQSAAMAAGLPERDGGVRKAEVLVDAFLGQLAQVEQSATSPEEEVLVEALREHFSSYRDHVRRCLDASAGGKTVEVPPEETVALARAVSQPCRQLLEVSERLLTVSAETIARQRGFVNLIRYVSLIAGPGVGILWGFWVAQGLRRSVSQIQVTLNDATGELKELGRIDLSPSGDLPDLQRQVELVAARIRQVTDELQQARCEARAADRLAAVGELAAGVAHELRNPLTSVKLLIQTAAQRQPAGMLGDRQLQVVQDEIIRMEHTIQGLLDFARPPGLHHVIHDLRDTVRRALNLVEARANKERVLLVESLLSSPVIVDGDPEQLHQVFVNLLLNGIDSMKSGGTLRVQMTLHAEDGACRVAFQDSGSGIPEEILERLFEPFVTGKDHGIGLGLAVSRRIIQEHGGTLTGGNQPERGAMFVVELPVPQALPGNDGGTPNGLAVPAAGKSSSPAAMELQDAHAADH